MPVVSPAPDVSSATNALRCLGLRVSTARRLVLEALYTADGPVTAEQVADGLGGRLPACDLGSVYRNLATLEGAGLVTALRPARGARMFAVRGREPAALACCESCGGRTSLAPLALARLRDAVRIACGLELAFAHHPVVGLCERCVPEPGPATRG